MKAKRGNLAVISAAGGALLVLLAAGGTADAAQRSRGNARPPGGSGGPQGSVGRSASPSSPSSPSSARARSPVPGSGGAAVTRPGGSPGGQVLRDTRGSGSGGHHHGHHGHHGYHGYYGYPYYGYYSPYYYPRWWGFYGHLGWGWGWGWGWPYYGYAPYAYAPYDAYWWTTGYAARTYPNGQYGGQGALDLDVRPEKAEVHLDGKYIGRADDFDGFPTYLWLPQGTYDVVFYHPGRRTLARQYTIYAGLILDVSDRLEEGEAIRPEDLPARSTVNRDTRLQRDRERREEAEQMEREQGGYWQRYEERHRERAAGEEQASGSQQASALHVRVTPGDASVYLDGRFVGTGDELRQREPALGVDAGEHRLEVVRPGHRPAIRRFTVVAGEPVLMEVKLEEEEY